jgi:hypothetical protein
MVSITGFAVLTAVVMNSSILRDMTPCSPLHVNQRWMKMPPTYFMLVSCLAYYSNLKMEKVFSSETSVAYHGTKSELFNPSTDPLLYTIRP